MEEKRQGYKETKTMEKNKETGGPTESQIEASSDEKSSPY